MLLTGPWSVCRLSTVIFCGSPFMKCFCSRKLVPNVAINEAVEIAKIYGTDDTPRFINGVLGKMVRSDV